VIEDFQRIIASEAAKKQDAERRLESLPYEQDWFSPESLNAVILINKDLKRVTANLNAERALSAARGYLDSHTGSRVNTIRL
jgi:hypothetical protein